MGIPCLRIDSREAYDMYVLSAEDWTLPVKTGQLKKSCKLIFGV